jgi:DNA-binding LacI/PurR family transcriptional regulator
MNIFDTVKGRIASGEYPGDHFLPSERELCEEFKVNRVTVRRSLDMLIADGIVEKQAGKGTLVLDRAKPPKVAPSSSGQKYILYMFGIDVLEKDRRITSPIHSGLFEPLERKCSRFGYHLIFKTVTVEDHIPDLIRGLDLSYLIFVSQSFSHFIAEAGKLNLPILTVHHQYPQFTSVRSDDFSSSQELIEYFIATGHRRISVLTGPEEAQGSQERYSAWESVMRKHGINYKDLPQYAGDWTFNSGLKAGEQIAALPKKERPDAVFAFNDSSAIGLIKALQERGISVPGDISVAGFDNSEDCIRVKPTLSTINMDFETTATAIFQQLYYFLQLSGTVPVIHIRIPTRLIIRESIIDRNALTSICPGFPGSGGELPLPPA